MTKLHNLFATTPKGLEYLLVDELRELGAINPAEKLAGVAFSGDLKLAYKACLWSRLANRILLQLAQVPAATPEELYQSVQMIDWSEHLDSSGTLNIDFTSSHSAITHTLFGAQKVKDAIVDQFRVKYHERPNVVRENPDICINVYLHRDIATISLDLSGESLHKRGYRLEQGAAPLKENLAAAILLRAGWKDIAKQEGMLLDPMCGSGTLLIEAALMAGNIAPGLLRNYFGFLGWKQHNASIWNDLIQEANQSREKNFASIPTIVGHDIDPHAIKIAASNIERAGLRGKIHVEKRELSDCVPKKSFGLLVVNPPYGERLGEMPELPHLYATLGAKLKNNFINWKAAVFTGNPDLGKNMGLRARKQYALFNGAIPSQLLLFDVQSDYFVDRSPSARNERRVYRAKKFLTEHDQASVQMFINRLRKNIKNIKRWAERENITCYRIYDADLPEYAVAIDFYNDSVCVEEYPAPKTVDKTKAEQRLQHVLAVLPDVLEVPAAKIFLREQAARIKTLDELYLVVENNTQFLVNLPDASLEVGLPLEQRRLRAYIREQAKNKSFLELFATSGSMSVCAAQGGARLTKSLQTSEFYLGWTRRNMSLNGFAGQFVVADVEQWVLNERTQYDLIFVDFSEMTFHVRQQYSEWIPEVCRLLGPQGELYVVTRDARFKLPPELFNKFTIENMANRMIPMDFGRRPNIQQCWKIDASPPEPVV